MKRLLNLLALASCASACESDQAKFSRLEMEQNTQCLNEQYYHDKSLAAYEKAGGKLTPATDTLCRKYQDHRAQCALATRDLARLTGR